MIELKLDLNNLVAQRVVGAFMGRHTSWVNTLGPAGQRSHLWSTSMAGSQIGVAVWVVGARLRVHTSWELVSSGTGQVVGARSLNSGYIPLVLGRSIPLVLSGSIPLVLSRSIPLLLFRWVPGIWRWLIPLGPILLGSSVPLWCRSIPLLGLGIPLLRLLLLLLRVVQICVVAVRVRWAQGWINSCRELGSWWMLTVHNARNSKYTYLKNN